MAEYNKLKVKAGKKAASLNQQLERVSEILSVKYVHTCTVWIFSLYCTSYTIMCVCVCVFCVWYIGEVGAEDG